MIRPTLAALAATLILSNSGAAQLREVEQVIFGMD